MNKRQFLSGLLASAAMPVVPKINSVDWVGLRKIIEYVPCSIKELDILYGYKMIKPEWLKMIEKDYNTKNVKWW